MAFTYSLLSTWGNMHHPSSASPHRQAVSVTVSLVSVRSPPPTCLRLSCLPAKQNSALCFNTDRAVFQTLHLRDTPPPHCRHTLIFWRRVSLPCGWWQLVEEDSQATTQQTRVYGKLQHMGYFVLGEDILPPPNVLQAGVSILPMWPQVIHFWARLCSPTRSKLEKWQISESLESILRCL